MIGLDTIHVAGNNILLEIVENIFLSNICQIPHDVGGHLDERTSISFEMNSLILKLKTIIHNIWTAISTTNAA